MSGEQQKRRPIRYRRTDSTGPDGDKPIDVPVEQGSSTATQRFFAAAVGAGFAELTTLPIDAAKVRLQLQSTAVAGSTPKYTGLMQGMYRIGVEEGLPTLWRGLEPALIRQCSYTGLSFVLYEPVRNAIAGNLPQEEIPFWKRVLAGGTAGGVSIIAMNPTDVLKTQMQAVHGEARPSMATIVHSIHRGGGILGFWVGVQPNVARCFIGNACEIGCYDEAKTRLVGSGLIPDGPAGHFAASAIAGTISAIFSTPVDVVKTRLMAQAGGTKTDHVRYSGVLDCFVRMPQLEGIGSLYKGFVPIAARKVAWTVAYFLCYEQVLRAIRGSYS